MELEGRHRRDGGTGRPDRAARSVNARRRVLVRGLLAALLGAGAGGCALSFPPAGAGVDGGPTGSIDRTEALLPAGLDGEDLRRARAAMAVALDPQGNGARTAWQNPQSGARGAFTALRSPFAEEDRVCRAFTGEVALSGAAARTVGGAACREGDGTWRVVRDGARP